MQFVSYLRVSTAKQGRSGLGLEAQRAAVDSYLASAGATLAREFVEVESGKRNDRPQLQVALDHARAIGATLVIAKLDRLSRDAHFLLGLQKAGVPFVCCDMPEANEMVVGIMAVVAQGERRMIADRTKAALAAAKARGVRLGNPNGARCLRGKGNAAAVVAKRKAAEEHARGIAPIIEQIRAAGHTSLRAIARELNGMGVLTPKRTRWYAASVRNLLSRLNANSKN